MNNSRINLSINLKYYRYKYNLSQGKFAEVIESNLAYVNQLENCLRKPTIDMLDKISDNLNKYDRNLKLTADELIRYHDSHIISYKRIDKKNNFLLKIVLFL